MTHDTSRARARWAARALVIAVLGSSSGCVVSPKAADGLAPDPAGQAFARLDAPQQRLVAAMAAAACADRSCTAAEHYATWPVSRQTTFEAATHGLLRTRLTDAAGRDLGRGIDIIASVDRVAGEEKGRRGDEQFRLYVALTPEAPSTIASAREFFRDKDNTVFHKGYPVNYRLAGRFPSVQVSMTEDGSHADIDVDYLSSRVPQGLFNGHLTAANSDVRVRGNDRRHNRRWQGLTVWWKALLELLAPAPPPSSVRGEALASDAPRGRQFARIDEAAAEFLADGFLRRNLDEALAFVSPNAAACVNVDDDAENEAEGSAATRRLIGEVLRDAARGARAARLSDVILPIEPWDPDWHVQAHPLAEVFTLASVDRREALAFTCRAGATVDPVDPDAFAQLIFQLRGSRDGAGAALAFLWRREAGAWRVISVDVLDP